MNMHWSLNISAVAEALRRSVALIVALSSPRASYTYGHCSSPSSASICGPHVRSVGDGIESGECCAPTRHEQCTFQVTESAGGSLKSTICNNYEEFGSEMGDEDERRRGEGLFAYDILAQLSRLLLSVGENTIEADKIVVLDFQGSPIRDIRMID